MPVFRVVRVTLEMIVEAESPGEAIGKLRAALVRAGVAYYELRATVQPYAEDRKPE
jgi:hypothetical protein